MRARTELDAKGRPQWRLRVVAPFAKSRHYKPGAILVTPTFDREARARLLAVELQDATYPQADTVEIWLDEATILEEKGQRDYDWKVKVRLFRTPETKAEMEGAGATLEPVVQSALDKVAILAQEMFS